MIKQLLAGIITTSFSVIASAQNNLQFHKPIRLSYSGFVASASTPVAAGSITVPENKVWKIESGSVLDSARLYPIQFNLLVDGQLLYSSSSSTNAVYSSPPIWLGAGTYPVTVTLSSSGNLFYTARISGIEFNLVQ